MFNKFAIAMLMALMLSACAGNQVKFSQVSLPTADPEHALIYIYRPTQFAMVLRAAYFNIDNVEVAELKSGDFTWFKVPAGSHDFSFNWAWDVSFGRKAGKVQSFEGGSTYYYRFIPSATILGNLMYFESVMEKVTEEHAMQEMNTLDYRGAKTPAELAVK